MTSTTHPGLSLAEWIVTCRGIQGGSTIVQHKLKTRLSKVLMSSLSSSSSSLSSSLSTPTATIVCLLMTILIRHCHSLDSKLESVQKSWHPYLFPFHTSMTSSTKATVSMVSSSSPQLRKSSSSEYMNTMVSSSTGFSLKVTTRQLQPFFPLSSPLSSSSSSSPSSASSPSSCSPCSGMYFKSLHPHQDTQSRFFYPKHRDEKQDSSMKWSLPETHGYNLRSSGIFKSFTMTSSSSPSITYVSSSPSSSSSSHPSSSSFPSLSSSEILTIRDKSKSGHLGNDLKAQRILPYSQNKSEAAILKSANDADDIDDDDAGRHVAFQNGGYLGNVDDGDYMYYEDHSRNYSDNKNEKDHKRIDEHYDDDSRDYVLISNNYDFDIGGDDYDVINNSSNQFNNDSLEVIYYDDDNIRYSDVSHDNDRATDNDDITYNGNDDDDYVEDFKTGVRYDDDDVDYSYSNDKEPSYSHGEIQRKDRFLSDTSDLEIRKLKRYVTSPSRDTYEVNISVVVIATWLAFVVAMVSASYLFVRVKTRLIRRWQIISRRQRKRGRVASELDTVATISHQLL